jgi:hypothetical protein
MIRKYNYTGRQKIANERIQIRQLTRSGIAAFEAKININDLGFPDYAKIYIEPYFKSSFMRFDFGTVARHIHPENTLLDEIPVTDKILFRVKVVDESSKQGLILGYADELIPTLGDTIGGKKPLLPVDYNDLGNKIWKLDFRDDGPYLSVNKTIDRITELVKNNLQFFSLVYPEIIRQIAQKIISEEDIELDDLTTWQGQWIQYFKTTLGITYKPDEEREDIWCEEIVEAFCRKHDVSALLTNK